MTLDGKSTIQRALGIIEGAAWGMDSEYAQAITTAVEMIDEVIGKEDTPERPVVSWTSDGTCPVCGAYDNKDPFGSKFCHNCGADMRGAVCEVC